jgi:hypothetical protein
MDEKAQLVKEATNQKIRDYHECFTSESGKRVLADLKKDMHYQEIVPINMTNEQVRQIVGSWNAVIRILNFLEMEIKP